MADHLQWFGDCGAVSPHTVSEVEFPIGATEECVFCEDDSCVATVRLKVCGDLVAFVHGELDEQRAAGFRDHISGCTNCESGLIEVAQLEARLSALGRS